MSMEYSEFLCRLREERLRCQITQIEMSRIIRSGQSKYCKAEKGDKRFSISEIQLMCDSNLDIYYIFTGKRGQGIYTTLEVNNDFDHILNYIKVFKIFIEDRPERCLEGVRGSISYLDYVFNPVGIIDNIFWVTRIFNGYTQAEMSRKINVDVKKLRALEGGQLLPDSELIFEMYKEFGVSPSMFLKKQNCIKNELCYLLDQLSPDLRTKFLVGIDHLFVNESTEERNCFEKCIDTGR